MKLSSVCVLLAAISFAAATIAAAVLEGDTPIELVIAYGALAVANAAFSLL